MKFVIFIFLIMAAITGIVAQDTSEYYYKEKVTTRNLYNVGLGLGNLGYSNLGMEWGVLSISPWLGHDRLYLSGQVVGGRANLSEAVTFYDYNSWSEEWELNKEYTGKGVYLAKLSFGYNLMSIGYDSDVVFKPFYLQLSPYIETPLIGYVDNKPRPVLFPYFDGGIKLQSSLIYAKFAYTYTRNATEPMVSNTEMILVDNRSGITASIGITIDLFNKYTYHKQLITSKRKIPKPVINISDYQISGTSGDRILQTDRGYLNLLLENKGKVDGEQMTAVLKPKGTYPGLSVGSSFDFSIKAKDVYSATIPITTNQAVPGDTYHTLEISPANSEYKIELPVTITLSPSQGIDNTISQSVYYNPSELDRDIPKRQVQNQNLKAVLVINENYRDESVEPIKVASNAAKTLKKYLTQTLGINEANIYEYKDFTISQLQDLVDPDEGLISNIVGNNDQLLLYIIAHGLTMQANQNNVSYLLGTDSNPYSEKRPGVSVRSIISDLEEIPMQNYMLFIDACYSGLGKGTMAPTTRLKTGSLVPTNGVVITSSEGDEVSNLMEDKGHTVFSYHLIKALQNLGKGKKPISVQALYTELGDKDSGIPGYTLRQFNRAQTPRLFGDNQIILSK